MAARPARIAGALSDDGIRAAGVDVVDWAACPPPTYFAAYELASSCVSVTAATQPRHNGSKMVLGGWDLFGESTDPRGCGSASSTATWSNAGRPLQVTQADVVPAYAEKSSET